MSSEGQRVSPLKVLSPSALPLFSTFFFWSFGTGALWVARPLFAYSLEQSVFLVALVSAANASSRFFTSPITGFLTDRLGRRPFLILGAVLHGSTLIGDFFVTSYPQYIILEFFGGIGISMWFTSSSVLMADVTTRGNRGRAVAIRDTASRVGIMLGPLVGGAIELISELRFVFLFIAATKVPIILVTLFLIREAKPQAPRDAPDRGKSPRQRLGLSLFKTPAVAALAFSAITTGMIGAGPGAYRTLFPIHAQETAGLDPALIGGLFTITAFVGLLTAFPNGIIVDRYGRKRPMVTGLLLMAFAAYLMATTGSYPSAFLAAAVYGLSEAVSEGSRLAYIMDLAPENQRGAFLGVFSVFTTTGHLLGPLAIGSVADKFGFFPAFSIIAIALGVSALIITLLAPETAGRRATLAAGESTASKPGA